MGYHSVSTTDDAFDLGAGDATTARARGISIDAASTALNAANPYPAGRLADAYDAGVSSVLDAPTVEGAHRKAA